MRLWGDKTFYSNSDVIIDYFGENGETCIHDEDFYEYLKTKPTEFLVEIIESLHTQTAKELAGFECMTFNDSRQLGGE